MAKTMTFTGTLHILTCGVCSIPHAIPEEMYRDRLDNGGEWFCPNGHNLHFITTEAEKLKRELAAVRRQAEAARGGQRWERDQRLAAERSARAVRGWNTRLRNRIANGVCPVAGCKRHVDNVQAHIAGRHPQWAAEHAEALA
jgi:hypothetical protein